MKRIIGGVKESEKSEMMSQEPYKKVGRGGAGNFYSKQDVERTSGASVCIAPLRAPSS